MKPENPFLTTGYYSPEYFCDREAETKQLLNYVVNGQNVTLTSVRRIGKTGLIKHLFYELPPNWKGIYVDILSTENLPQFLNALATSILQTIPEKESFGEKLWGFIKSMRPIITFDSLTYLPQASFEMKIRETENHIGSILRFLEEQDFRIIVAIDEFQQIVKYPEKNTDAWLRTIIQQMNNVKFIFSGSQQHVINELFNSPSRPFYRSTVMQNIGKIDDHVYHDFILNLFNANKRQISDQVIEEMLQWANCHTFYVQLICSRVFANGHKKVTGDVWRMEAFKLIKELELVFYNYRNLLTIPQWQLLKAVALEGTVYSPTSKEFINNYKLGSPSTVLRSLRSLIDCEMIYSSFTSEGTLYYTMHDVLFQHWVKTD